MRWKLALDDVLAKCFGDLDINGKFSVNARRRKVLHRRYYAKRFRAKQAFIAKENVRVERILPVTRNLQLRGKQQRAFYL